MALMTQAEFVAYAHEMLNDMECLYDTIAEHNGEVAQFGDSWPGALVRIHKQIREVKRLEACLARIERREPRDFQFRVYSPR